MQTLRIPVRAAGVIEAEVDGERVLLSPKDYAYFGLADSGAQVWDLIDGTRSIDDMVQELAANYNADPEVIRADVMDFLSGLGAAGLLIDLT